MKSGEFLEVQRQNGRKPTFPPHWQKTGGLLSGDVHSAKRWTRGPAFPVDSEAALKTREQVRLCTPNSEARWPPSPLGSPDTGGQFRVQLSGYLYFLLSVYTYVFTSLQ